MFAFLIFNRVVITVLLVSLGLLLMYDRPQGIAMMVILAGGGDCLFFVTAYVFSIYDGRRRTEPAGMWCEAPK
jgi:hypothetical protein